MTEHLRQWIDELKVARVTMAGDAFKNFLDEHCSKFTDVAIKEKECSDAREEMFEALIARLSKGYDDDVCFILWLFEKCGISFDTMKKADIFDEEDINWALGYEMRRTL